MRFFRPLLILFVLLPAFSLQGQDTLTANAFKPKLMLPKGHEYGPYSARFSPDGRQVVTGEMEGRAKVWDVESGKLLHDLLTPLGSLAVNIDFSPRGNQILTIRESPPAQIWDAKSGRLLHNLVGRSGWLISGSFSPDGLQIVVADGDGLAEVWDAESGELLHELEVHEELRIISVQYSPDSRQIMTVSYEGPVKVWDAKTGQLLHDLVGRTKTILSARYSPDGRQIVTGGGEIWDAQTGQLLYELAHEVPFKTAQFSPSGDQIVTAGGDSIAKVWDTANGQLLHVLVGHTEEVFHALYSPDGRQIVTAGDDSIAKVWDAESGRLLYDLIGHTRPISSVQYSLDGRQIVTASWDGTAKIWNAENGQLLQELGGGNTFFVRFANYSSSGDQIEMSGARAGTGKIWDLSGQLLHKPAGESFSGYFQDCRQIVTEYYDNEGVSTAKLRDAASGQLLYELTGERFLEHSPDCRQIVTEYHDNEGVSTAKLRDAASGQLLYEFVEEDFLRYSPDGRQIVTEYYVNKGISAFRVRDAASGQLLYKLVGEYLREYSPDGRQIVTLRSGYGLRIRVRDAASGQLLYKLAGQYSPEYSPDGRLNSTIRYGKGGDPAFTKVRHAASGQLLYKLADEELVDFSPDGRQIVTSGSGATQVRDAASGQLLYKLVGDFSGCSYSPDGRQIVLEVEYYDYENGIDTHITTVRDAASGQLLYEFVEEDFLRYSPDGRQIVTASREGIVKVRDAASGQLLYELSGAAFLKYSPDGSFLMTGSADGALALWSADTGEELLKLYFLDESDWVVMHPSGLFDATPNAMELMYYVVGNEIIELSQLKERYYEPGLYQQLMTPDGLRGLRDVRKFDSVEMYPEMWASIESDTLKVRLKERNGGIGQVSLFINNKEVLTDANASRDTLFAIDLEQFQKYYRLDTTNQIGLRAFNTEGWLRSRQLSLEYEAGFVLEKGEAGGGPLLPISTIHDPRYYAIVVGTSDYTGDKLDLRYAAKDSRDMALALRQTAQELFEEDKVQVYWLSTDTGSGALPASKNDIRAVFDAIAAVAQPQDVLIVYFSGHGMTYGPPSEEQFFYLTKDVFSGDLTDSGIRGSYAISTEEMTKWLNAIPAQKQVMILDACSSGKVVDDLLAVRNVPASQIRALDRMKDRTGMFVLAGSAADRASYEASQFGQGLLTYSILLGMRGGALREGGSVDVMQLFQFARDQVPRLAESVRGIQRPTLASPADASSFDIGLVTEKVEIPLQEVKPVFLRSNFQEEYFLNDPLGLAEKLNAQLRIGAVRAIPKGVIFFDADRYEGGYSIVGRYTLEGEMIKVRGALLRSGEPVGVFAEEGQKDDVDALANRILEKVSGIMKEKKD